MKKIDLSKLYRSAFNAPDQPEIVELPSANYVSICGKGDPSSEAFAADIQALYSVAYAIKFDQKAKGIDFTVSKLEGLWWFDEDQYGHYSMDEAPQKVPRSEWEYRLLIRLPEHLTEQDVNVLADNVAAKKKLESARKVCFFTLNEGKCVQMMHTGPFSTEPETLQKLGVFIAAHGFGKNGLHHEVYLSDFRKTAPEKLKTILREPVV